MPKLKRGKNAKKTSGWRGTCPNCLRKRVRILWPKAAENGEVIQVCKRCGN